MNTRTTLRIVPLAALAFCLCAGPARPAEEAGRETMDVSRSSWIEEANYEREPGADKGRLVLRIKGEEITYLDVPAAVWRAFEEAESAGAFYTKNIKNRYERIKGEPLASRIEAIEGGTGLAHVECAFNEECEPMILRAIGMATNSIRVAAYAFTRTRIGAALADAHRRGVDVRVKMDAQQAQYPSAVRLLEYLDKNGVPVARITVKGDYAAMHNKFLVVDGRYVLAGSYNFTTTAGAANWENMLFVDSPEIAARYRDAWDAIVSE